MTEGFTKNPAIPSSICIFLGKDVCGRDSNADWLDPIANPANIHTVSSNVSTQSVFNDIEKKLEIGVTNEIHLRAPGLYRYEFVAELLEESGTDFAEIGLGLVEDKASPRVFMEVNYDTDSDQQLKASDKKTVSRSGYIDVPDPTDLKVIAVNRRSQPNGTMTILGGSLSITYVGKYSAVTRT